MQYATLLVQILHPKQYLLHQNSYLILFVETVLPFFATFLYILRETAIHLFKNQIQFAILKFYSFCSHHIWTVSSFSCGFNFIETLEDLYLSLVKGLLFGLKLVLEFFDSTYFACLNMSATIHMSKRATSDQFLLFILVPNDQFGSIMLSTIRTGALLVVILIILTSHVLLVTILLLLYSSDCHNG